MYRLLPTFLLVFISFALFSQEKTPPGLVTGNLLDTHKNAVAGATVELIALRDSVAKKTTQTDKNGNFSFNGVVFGFYRIYITSVSFQPLTIDSIHLRSERYDFNLNDLTLQASGGQQLNEVVVYAEKPLIQSKDGNITFNAAESALSAGSNAADLLKTVPLVANDPDGKLTVRGKEPKILIDDKPVEMSAQQLQDFLESLPGNMIERIEVMTNPPPQYANEQGGVINIVTRKGKVGIGGRLGITYGTRNETGINGNISYRKKGLAINFNAGFNYNRYSSDGYSNRQNFYTDSTNYFSTTSQSRNRNTRPGARLSVDYDIDARNLVNVLVLFNQNTFKNRGDNEYINRDQHRQIYKLSNRFVETEGENVNPGINLTYTHKGKAPGETLRLIASANYSYSENNRLFFQQYLNPDRTPTGSDSTQQQLNTGWNPSYNIRINYDKLLDNKTTSISTGIAYNYTYSHSLLDYQWLKKPENVFLSNALLSNDLGFRQSVSNARFSIRQVIVEGLSVTGGITGEATDLHFDFLRDKGTADNDYFNWLPFANLNKNWNDQLNLSLAYRKVIRRPGITQLNPTIDNSDPFNIRYGNLYLLPSSSHNFDLVVGRTKMDYFVNLGLGYNIVKDVFSQIRKLNELGQTEITWQNLDDRHEYEISSWAGYTFSRALRLNFSTTYTYNAYSAYDKNVNRYRNGSSITSSLNTTFSPTPMWNINTNFTYNRFANPQGTVRSNVRMNIGIQRKFFDKRFIVTVNAIDPFFQQEYSSFTYGTNYTLESVSNTTTRNFRLTLTYNFTQQNRIKKLSTK